ncbi:hypothetical protein [Phytohabitans rumicis]|uniref:Uncharacterized protein n=1 Tax=Phytohabitans rumicis TaxID=1076125 RepID=A0A6V8LP56_9ACTN|nr:hypothetical protein [Phytohabitans rumicis]GFJ95996.1 hypothetical protein Prum_096380 [Phytohabitans rumicis]
MIQPVPADWNTWDVQYHTAAAHLPSGTRVRVALGTPDGALVDDFTWRRGLERLGHHTVDGEYAEVTVRHEETLLRLVFARPRPDVLCGLAELDGAGSVHLIVDTLPGAPAGDGVEWPYAFSAPVTAEVTDAGARRLSFPPDAKACRFVVGGDEGDLAFDFDAARERAESAAIGSSGWLGRSAEGYQRALTWNTVIRSDLGRVITPTSRDFVSQARDGFYGTWALHGWDTFFCGLAATWIDHDYSRGIYDQILEQITPAASCPTGSPTSGAAPTTGPSRRSARTRC